MTNPVTPWTVQPDRNDAEMYEVAGVYLVAGSLPIEDAHLIAAAPELLDALFQYRNDLRYPPAPDSIERRLAMIEKLVAKATGAA